MEIAFESHAQPPALELAVNFGLVTGRQATEAEIGELARRLVPLVGGVGIVAERRHEFGRHSEATLEQVRIELDDDHAPLDREHREELRRRVVDWVLGAAESGSVALLSQEDGIGR